MEVLKDEDANERSSECGDDVDGLMMDNVKEVSTDGNDDDNDGLGLQWANGWEHGHVRCLVHQWA